MQIAFPSRCHHVRPTKKGRKKKGGREEGHPRSGGPRLYGKKKKTRKGEEAPVGSYSLLECSPSPARGEEKEEGEKI